MHPAGVSENLFDAVPNRGERYIQMMKKENNDNKATVESKAPVTRYHFLDTVRGLLIVGMVISHLILDLHVLGVADLSYFLPTDTLWIKIIQTLGVFLFLFISGICSRLSRSNLKRGIIALLCSFGISIVTWFITPDMFIYLGMLHLLSICMIMSHFVVKGIEHYEAKKGTDRRIRRAPAIIGAIVLALLFILTFNIYDPGYGIGVFNFNLPLEGFPLYGTFGGYLLGFGGYTGITLGEYTGLMTADYHPLMPWVFAFFSGLCLGGFFKRKEAPEFFQKKLCPPLAFIGRHSLLIYLAHQPIIFGICMLLGWLI